MQIEVASEVEPLRRVVVHRPGPEVVRMTQFELEPLLFDDILSADLAGREHDLLREILEAEGAEVIEVVDLLQGALRAAPDEQIHDLVTRTCDRAGQPELVPLLRELELDRLAEALICGLFWRELRDAPLTLARIRQRLQRRDSMALRPVPNLMFMRDPCIAVYDRLLVGRMATDARAREPLLVRFALQYGAGLGGALLFHEADWQRHRCFRAIEGGDLLVMSPRFLLIGCSERTSPQSIERVAREALFPTFQQLERVYAIVMPALRSVMHLDTVLTQIDRELFLGHAPMVVDGHDVAVVRLERGKAPVLLDGATVHDILREELGPQVQIVPCGGDDPLFRKREQWTDGANAVCARPGRILLYSRNVRTIDALVRRHGFVEVAIGSSQGPLERQDRLEKGRGHSRVVYTFTGSELSRARGGARCMTMPLQRGALA